MALNLLDSIQKISQIETTAYSGVAYRFHNPVWAWSPLSMEGARRTGGRFNPVGVSALYLGLSVECCYGEVTEGATRGVVAPQLLCSYRVNSQQLIDIRGPDQHLFEPAWRLAKLNNTTPPGWLLHEAVKLRPEINGLIVPSFAVPGESNLVLFSWSAGDIQLYDPDGRLAAVYGDRLDQD